LRSKKPTAPLRLSSVTYDGENGDCIELSIIPPITFQRKDKNSVSLSL